MAQTPIPTLPLQPSVRLSHLDWLRIFIIAILIPFHTAMTFAPYGWYVRNNPISNAAMGLVQFQDKYHMELLFFIAGVATWFSFGVRGWGKYLLERLQRLVVPVIFAMFVIVPPCYYIAGLHFDRLFRITYGGFWDWYTTAWLPSMTPFSSFWGVAPRAGALWFLWYLVLYTFALFPLFSFIYRKAKDTCLPKLAGLFEKPGAIFLLVIPIALVLIFLPWKWTIGGDSYRIVGWMLTGDFQVLYYVIFFTYGFLLYASPRFQRGIDRSGIIAIIIAAVTMTLCFLLTFPEWNTSVWGTQFWTRYKGEPFTAGRTMFNILLALTAWSWIVSVIYLARRFLNRAGGFVRWANDAVLPVYIVHSTFIAVFSYYVVQWRMDVLPKYAIIVVLTYIGSIGWVQLAKLSNPTRFLMGIRLKKKAPAG